MIQRKFIIKDGVLLETKEVRIEDRTKLFKYNPNLRMLADDISPKSRNITINRFQVAGTSSVFSLS